VTQRPTTVVPARLAVVVAGGAVLVVETLAARLVAPYVGLTLESYTAAIGVALLGIAVGAKIGGGAADRIQPARVLAGALAGGGALVLMVRPIVLVLGPFVPRGPASAVVLVAASTMPAVTVLSMVAPAAVKHRLHDLGHSGRVVGDLSALGTLGALAGTFLTGYVLVATLPTWAVLGVTGAACLTLALVAAPAGLTGRGDVPLAMITALLAAAALAGVRSPCDVETAYYCAAVTTDPARPTGRVLLLDDLRHSYVDLADPTHLEFAYIKRFAATIDATFPTGRSVEAVHIGGGGFTMPRWLAATRPGSRSTVLELDPAVVRLGREHLGVSGIPDLRVVTGDARLSLRAVPDDSADVVILDAFGSLSVPWHLATREYLSDVRRVLRPAGIVILNIIDNGPKRFLAAEARTLATVLGTTALVARPDQLSADSGGNFVLVGTDAPLDVAALQTAAAGREPSATVLAGALYADLAAPAPTLTDDYAPVDQLLTPYPRSRL
jgi:spermidine synthase